MRFQHPHFSCFPKSIQAQDNCRAAGRMMGKDTPFAVLRKEKEKMASDNQVFAWTGTDGRLNVQVGTSGQPNTLSQTSNNGPAIALFNGTYYLAWTGTNGQLNIITSTDGVKWLEPTTLQENSNNGPTLAISPSKQLYLGWVGTDGRLNTLTLQGSGWSDKVILKQTSNKAYSLAIQ
ncbi:MAG TPA: hypothetical protein VFY05_00905 [Candidatus Angelobacter sp.]|nr:hypothetical protein [Candidatus Angelobacter sp.]